MQDSAIIGSAITLTVMAALIGLIYTAIQAYAPKVLTAMDEWANTHISAELRAAMYAAVKIGLRVARDNKLTADDLLDKATKVASTYLIDLGIEVTPEQIRDMIRAERQKLADQDAAQAALLQATTPTHLN